MLLNSSSPSLRFRGHEPCRQSDTTGPALQQLRDGVQECEVIVAPAAIPGLLKCPALFAAALGKSQQFLR